MKRSRTEMNYMPNKKRQRTEMNYFFDLPDDLVDYIFTFIKRPRIEMNYSENMLIKRYQDIKRI
jgi:hypothetical protein